MADRFTSPSMASVRFVAQRGMLRPLVWRLVRVSIVGTERLRELEAPYIAVANHSSHLDAPLVIGSVPTRLGRYLAAGAAADYFFDVQWRKWLTTLFFNAFAIDRGNSARNRPGMSKKLLDEGVPLLIFPEGGRSKTGEMGKFKAGAAALSISAGVPILPIALIGASKAMPRGVNWPLPGRYPVCVAFGDPMRQAGSETAEEFNARVAEAVRTLHDSFEPTGKPVTARRGSK